MNAWLTAPIFPDRVLDLKARATTGLPGAEGP